MGTDAFQEIATLEQTQLVEVEDLNPVERPGENRDLDAVERGGGIVRARAQSLLRELAEQLDMWSPRLWP